MGYQTTFMRHELKFLLDRQQQQLLLQAMEPFMSPDKYGRTCIANIYYDTDNDRLIRRSLDKPVYKEKLRLRSYGRADADSTVYVELKKKYRSIVYKRRIAMPNDLAVSWLQGQACASMDSQIGREICQFLAFYRNLQPRLFLSYHRQAWDCNDGSDLRITMDDTILFRQRQLSLTEEPWGTPLLEPDQVLMEIKTSGGLPLWLAGFLSRNHIYKTSFSKYGNAYRKIIHSQSTGGHIHA